MNIVIGRYEVPTAEEREAVRAEWGPEAEVGFPADRWECTIEPEDRSWIVFIPVEGPPAVWTKREPSGAVIGAPLGGQWPVQSLPFAPTPGGPKA